ncbi:MAG: peptidoglycan-associated lipoprotein Pal [Nitrospirae bacterium]|nr:MAG: peptidoglycan-associated lipoprotein Pal [Nitrospirota bacterium]
MNRRILLLLFGLTLALTALTACAKKNIRETPATPTEVSEKQDEGELFAVTPSGGGEEGLLGGGEAAGGEAATGGAAGGEETVGTPPVPSPETQGIEDVFFAFDSAELSEEARATLAKDAAIMKRLGGHYLIEGHCDERGSAEYNLALGDRRARAARDYLVSLGVDPANLSTISYGEERPFAEGHNEAAWAQNRRAHFVAQ